jgi:DnaJ-class molecular chaperone
MWWNMRKLSVVAKALDALAEHLGLKFLTSPCDTCNETGYLQDEDFCPNCEGTGLLVEVAPK